jgi:tRNA threonylcarbamoyl adenosine modification protein YeaZ
LPNSEPLVLGFDTSAAHCAAALVCGSRVLTVQHEDMARGQAERLMGLLEEVLQDAGKTWQDLDRIGVGIGPGNFTGIRIAVSTARGLALGLGIPAIGVNSFEAMALDAKGVPAVPAPRGLAYLQPAGQDPYLASENELIDLMEDGALSTPQSETIAMQIAKVAAACQNPDAQPAPKPLYIKPADAAPPRDMPPQILDA